MSFTEYKEYGLTSGLGFALCYRLQNETKYHILAAVETLPAVTGAPASIEVSTTTNRATSTVLGKWSAEDIDIPIPYNIDNINSLERITEKTISFAYIYLNDFSGQEFVGTPTYRLDDINPDSVAQIILNIKVLNRKENITKDLSDLYMDTITFNDNLPTIIELKTSSVYNEDKEVSLIISPSNNATVAWSLNSTGIVKVNDGTEETGTVSDNKLKITAVSKGSCSLKLVASADGYAPNYREIRIFVDK